MWYIASLISMPDWVASELNTLIFSFFWSGKRDLVAKDLVQCPSVTSFMRFWLSGSVVMLLPRMRGFT